MRLLYAILVVAASGRPAPIAGRVSYNRTPACPSGARRVLVYRRSGADAGASVARARHGAWIEAMAALSESFGRPPTADADASDYCSHLPCVIRTHDAHVAEVVLRCRPAYEQVQSPRASARNREVARRAREAPVVVPALVPTARGCATAKTYAVMISGQVQRFIWKDQREPLIAPADAARRADTNH
mmetsp:Transcript_20563/g.61309  ORF Transcript_20563/g.61309 Transcript_20563/m.61309 type:complete len:187 (-) Transcript_20563:62-622(-)